MKSLLIIIFVFTGCASSQKTSSDPKSAEIQKIVKGFYNLEAQKVDKLSCKGQMELQKATYDDKAVFVPFEMNFKRDGKQSQCGVTFGKLQGQDIIKGVTELAATNGSGFSSFCTHIFHRYYFSNPVAYFEYMNPEKVNNEYVTKSLVVDSDLKYLKVGNHRQFAVTYQTRENQNLPENFKFFGGNTGFSSEISVSFKNWKNIFVPEKFMTHMSGAVPGSDVTYTIHECN